MTDNEYIDAIAAGNQEVFALLYKSYRSEFKGFIRNKFHLSEDQIIDIYQDACTVLWSNISEKKYISENRSASLKTYLFRIGINITTTILRHNRVISTDKDLSYISKEYIDPSYDYDKEERKMVIREVIDKMTEPCNKILTLFYWEDLSCKEIVEKTEYKNENSVKSQKAKCMRKIESVVSNLPNKKM